MNISTRQKALIKNFSAKNQLNPSTIEWFMSQIFGAAYRTTRYGDPIEEFVDLFNVKKSQATWFLKEFKAMKGSK